MKFYDEIKKTIPKLSQFEKDERIVVFKNILTEKTHQETKTPPIYLGLASDLTFGIGISTAATESNFGGTTSFHAELTNFNIHKTIKAEKNNHQLRSIFALKTGIIDYINSSKNDKTDKYNECKQYFDDLLINLL